MQYFDYPTDMIETIKRKVHDAQDSSSSQPLIAAFDADGTLWNTDIGEFFFRFQIENKLVNDLPPNPFQVYEDKKSISPPNGLAWLAQINAGHSLSDIQAWGRESFKSFQDIPIFPQQKKLIEWLHSQNIEVYIVTASCKWAAEPFAHLFNIPTENVLGIETETEPSLEKETLITNRVINPITWREGKVEKLKQVTGQHPLLAVGNTLGDLPLLESAKISIAVRANPKNHPLFTEEEKLHLEAKKRGWLSHSFSSLS